MRLGELFQRNPGEEPEQDGDLPENTWMDATEAFPIEDPHQRTSMPPLTAAHIDAVRFNTAKPGYAFAQVEEFVQQVSDTLRRIEQDVHAKDTALHDAHEDIRHLQQQVGELQTTIEVFRAKGDPLVDEEGNYVRESAVAELNTVARECEELRERLTQLESDIAQWDAAYTALEEENKTLTEQLHEATASVPTASGSAEEEVERLQAALAEAQADYAASRGELEELRLALTAEQASEKADLASDSNAALLARLDVAETNRAQAAAERDAAVAGLAKAAAERDAAETELTRVRDATAEAAAERDSVEADRNRLATDLAQIQDLLRETQASRDTDLAALVAERDAAVQARDEAAAARDAALTACGIAQAEAAAARHDASEPAAELQAALAAAIRERDEALAAEAELQAYIDTVLAEWQAYYAAATGQAPEEEASASEPDGLDTSASAPTASTTWPEPEDGDEAWGDVPVAGELPTPPGGVPVRQRALLSDAPELQSGGSAES